jgi:hypothetical protein
VQGIQCGKEGRQIFRFVAAGNADRNAGVLMVLSGVSQKKADAAEQHQHKKSTANEHQ